jgi:hypothetical protein
MNDACPLVIIRWQDSAQPIPSWQHLAKLAPAQPVECATVGWLLRDDDATKVVCQSVGDLQNAKNAQASGIMTIPTRCVLSIENLSQEAPPTSAPSRSEQVPILDCNRREPPEVQPERCGLPGPSGQAPASTQMRQASELPPE